MSTGSWQGKRDVVAQAHGTALDALTVAWPITLDVTRFAVTRRYGRIEDEDVDGGGIDREVARLERLRRSMGAAQHKRREKAARLKARRGAR